MGFSDIPKLLKAWWSGTGYPPPGTQPEGGTGQPPPDSQPEDCGPETFGAVLEAELVAIRERRAVFSASPSVFTSPPSEADQKPTAKPPRWIFQWLAKWFSDRREARASRRQDVSPTDAAAKVADVSPTDAAAKVADVSLTDAAIKVADPQEELNKARALDENLVGLAFSGGGIRSATFNLGVLQGIADLNLLKNFDYLSCVSGGAYIASWLTSWVRREGSLKNVEKQLRPGRVKQSAAFRTWEGKEPPEPMDRGLVREEEPEPIYHLRTYSNYLAPRTGPLSVDTWVLVAIYLRNLLLNQLIILPATLALILISRYVILVYKPAAWDTLFVTVGSRAAWYDFLAGLMIGLALGGFIWSSSLVRPWREMRTAAHIKWRSSVMNVLLAVKIVVIVSLVLSPLAILIAHSGFGFWPGFFGSGADVTPFDLIVIIGFVVGLCSSDILVWFVRGVRRESGTRSGKSDQISQMQLSVLLPFVGASILLCQQFEAGSKGFVVGSPWLLEHTMGGHRPASWLNDVLPRWLNIGTMSTGLGRASAFGTFIGLLYGVERLLVFVRDLRMFILALIKWKGVYGALLKLLESIVSGFLGIGIGFLSGAILYSLIIALVGWTHQPYTGGTISLAVLGPPAVLLVLLTAGVLRVGLLGDSLTDDTREWWASLSAWVLLCAVGWGAVLGSTMFGRFAVNWVGFRVGSFAVAQTALVAGWLGTSVSGVIAAASSKSSSARRGGLGEWIAAAAPPVFLAGLLVFTSILAGWILGDPVPRFGRAGNSAKYWAQLVDMAQCSNLRWWIGLFGLVFLIMWWRVNVNHFSLHDLYANRLVRCYMGASRPREVSAGSKPKYSPSNCGGRPRRPNAITGFDAKDDLSLHDLRIRRHKPAAPEDCYVGPYLLINTAMNLVRGEELAWQERMAESFVLSPIFCGSKSTGYRRLPEYGGGLSLGRAMSISGAAASPNMGYHSSPAVTALMTIFNVRLGWWLGNPAFSKWRNPGPGMGSYLLDEFFGRSSARQDYVYLSDGGHFENLGVYELIRRRCRFILACDAGADPGLDFFDLGSLVRKCRSDFGVRIEIETSPLEREGPLSKSRWHCTVGTIRYEDIDPHSLNGVLVYLKPSLTGDEPSDVRNYASQFPAFPHQSTTNQFFSESQFESYRELGHHIVIQVLEKAVGRIGSERDRTDELFLELERRWKPEPPDLEKNFSKTSKALIELQRELSAGRNSALSRELYPELALPPFPLPGSPTSTTLYKISQMLHLMQESWNGNRLEKHYDHPTNRGWINAFRRWNNSESFRRYWSILRGDFTEDFIRFCEEKLNLCTWLAGVARVFSTVAPAAPPLGAPLPPAAPPLGAPLPPAAPPLGAPLPPAKPVAGLAVPAQRDCDASQSHPALSLSSFQMRSPARPPETPIRYALDNPRWMNPFREINREFLLEWPALRWKGKGFDDQGDGLDPLVAAAMRTEVEEGLSTPVWLVSIPRTVGVSERSSREGPEVESRCGVIILWRRAEGDPETGFRTIYELFVWLRAPYRNIGIGRQALSQVLQQIWWERHSRHVKGVKGTASQGPFTIETRYPAYTALGVSPSPSPMIWLNFFRHFAFRRPRLGTGASAAGLDTDRPSDLVVTRTFYPELWSMYEHDRDRAAESGRSTEGMIASSRYAPATARPEKRG